MHFMRVLGGILLIAVCLQVQAKEQGETAVAVFAGGCFWCMEKPFDVLDGVLSTTSGYIGGSPREANYKAVSSGRTGHVEAVEIEYNPTKVDFATLLEVFWKNVDPFDNRGQFCDKGSQYLSYIYYYGDEQKTLAETSLAKIKAKFDKPIATKVIEGSKFYPAETYHQDYYKKNPVRYKFYRTGCGRDRRLEQVWGAS
ncbi:peptide-methionine (S)-S-oxide reductase MsrA [Agarilytica rhodophyticola]|uniref:peptide-methionine (S)-S-oxide reductase MsrA n=1 Tax=Agarilytica rhodophyticola TaxID=1737490 RepID=UPI000B344C26|nr:peptide-methionine (S)-S-oxide reductase MsrA [Agarilytica rhodophyticola]